MIAPDFTIMIQRNEGSIYRGLDGKAYKVINGRSVEVPLEMLGGSESSGTFEAVVNGKTYRNVNGSIFLVENNQMIPITDQEQIRALGVQMEKDLNKSKISNEMYIFGALILVGLLGSGRN